MFLGSAISVMQWFLFSSNIAATLRRQYFQHHYHIAVNIIFKSKVNNVANGKNLNCRISILAVQINNQTFFVCIF